LLEIDERDLASSQRTIVSVVLDIHAFSHQLVDAAVLFEQRWQFGLHHLANGILSGLQWQAKVQASNGLLEPLPEHDLIMTLALRSVSIGADLLLTFDAVVQRTQLLQQRLLHVSFG